MKRKEKLIGLFMVLFTVISVNAFAGGSGHDKHSGSVSVTANGNGTVYISNSNEGTDIDGVNTENGKKTYNWSCEGSSDNDSKTFVLRAVPAKGYVFTGWSGSGNNSNANFSVTINANSNTNSRSYTATFAEGHTYYTRVSATAVGTGLVYVGTKNNPSDEEYDSEIVADNKVFQASAPSARYYWVAKEINGSNYKFVGWYDNPECTGDPLSTDMSININPLQGVEGEGDYTARYAKFVPYETYYSSVTVVAQEGGTVYVSNGQGEPNLNDYTTAMTLGQNSTTKDVPSHIYTLYAQANPGYEFKGWQDASVGNDGKVTITANSTDKNNPTVRTITAVFEKIGATYNDLVYDEVKPNSTIYLLNSSTNNYIGSTNRVVNKANAQAWKVGEDISNTYIASEDNSKYINDGKIENSAGRTWKFDRQNDGTYYITYQTQRGTTYYLRVNVNIFDYQIEQTNNGIAFNRDWIVISEEQMKFNHSTFSKTFLEKWNELYAHLSEDSHSDREKASMDAVLRETMSADYRNVEEYISKIDAELNKYVEVTLSVKADKYGTFIAPFDVTLPEGVSAYSATINNAKTYVDVTELVSDGGVLDANTPVILKNSTESDIKKTYCGPKATEVSKTAGVLIGYYKADEIVSEGYYALQTQNGEQKFYPIMDSDYPSTANKCYLIVPTGANPANLRIHIEGEETAVEEIATPVSVKEYFSVNGTKLSAPQKGVNLVKMSDGSIKKVFVK